MNKPLKVRTNFDRAAISYAEWILKWRWAVMLVAVVLAIAAGAGAKNLEFVNNYRVFFSAENPQLQAFEEIQNIYTKNDNALIMIEAKDGDVFTPEVLDVVEQITDEVWQLPFVIRVDSISNFQHTRAEEDDLIVEDLVDNALSMSADQVEYARNVATGEPALINKLISPDSSVTAINATIQFPEERGDEVSEVVTAARDLVRKYEEQYPFIDGRITGTVMMNISFQESSQKDISTLIPLMFGVIVLVMLLLLRCVASTFATVLVILLSIISAMGLAGWAGIFMTSPSAAAPTVILTLAVADSIHILVSMFAGMRHGMTKHEAIVDSLRINMQPVFLTSVTTAIGFLAMNFSDVPPFHDLGNIVATGVMLAFVFSVTFLPAIVSLLPCRKSPTGGRMSARMDRFADFVIRRRNPLLVSMTILSIALLLMIPRNEFNDEFVKYFSQNIEFRRDTDFATERLTGLYQVHYSIPAEGSNGVSDPKFLQDLDAFATWYRAQPEVLHVSTITDMFKRLNRNMHNDDDAWYRLPDQRDLAAQYLLLYELSLPFGLDLNNQLNIDKSATQFIATVDTLSSAELRGLVSRSEQWLSTNAPSMTSTGIGVSVMFAHISDRNNVTIVKGGIFSLVLISAILMLALRSVKMGFISLLPNLLPIGLAFGIWGALVGQINMASSIVAGMVLGIVVDDTVHFLSKFLRARRERGLNTEDAVRYAFHTVGIALVVTTMILVAGFAVLTFSNFELNSTMGKLTAIGIALAIVVDFLLLPPVLMKLDRGKPVRETKPLKSTDRGEAYAT